MTSSTNQMLAKMQTCQTEKSVESHKIQRPIDLPANLKQVNMGEMLQDCFTRNDRNDYTPT